VAALLVLARQSGAADKPYTEVFGTSRGAPSDMGFFFIDGRYVDPPYVLERRGHHIYINEELVWKGHEWPPYDDRVSDDPGDPPPGLSPLEKAPAGVDRRDLYWSRKARYLIQHHDIKVARQKYAQALKSSPAVSNVYVQDNFFIHITDVHGMNEVQYLDHDHSGPPPTVEERRAELDGKFREFEKIFARPDGAFFLNVGGGSRWLGRRKTLEMFEVLLSEQGGGEKIRLLSDRELIRYREIAIKVVVSFQAGESLLRRLAEVKKGGAAERARAELAQLAHKAEYERVVRQSSEAEGERQAEAGSGFALALMALGFGGLVLVLGYIFITRRNSA
jgi:hypothetical protein